MRAWRARRQTPFASSRSEGNIVVHVTIAGASRDCATRRRRGRTEIAVGIIRREIAARAAAAAIEHGQARVEPLQHHLGRVFLDASLVGPFARLQLALDVNFGALLEILLGDLAEPFIEDDHAVPLGLFLALAGRLVAPAFGSRDTEIGNRPPILGTPDFRILAEISDQNHLVHASCHRRSPLSKTLDWPEARLSARALALVCLDATLYAPRSSEPDDPSVIHIEHALSGWSSF